MGPVEFKMTVDVQTEDISGQFRGPRDPHQLCQDLAKNLSGNNIVPLEFIVEMGESKCAIIELRPSLDGDRIGFDVSADTLEAIAHAAQETANELRARQALEAKFTA